MPNTTDDLDTRWHSLLFDVRRSVRYHTRRRAFFDRYDQFTNMVGLVFGSTAVYGVMAAEPGLSKVAIGAAAIVTVMSSINLVVGSSQRAREHADFARQFIGLEKMLSVQPNEDVLAQVTHARLTIEAEEPPVMQVLDCICHNELCQAMGYPERAHIGFWQRLFAQIVDIRPECIRVSVNQGAA